jgi:hypothetical protein
VRKSILLSFSIALALFSCVPIGYEPEGSADFYIKNNTSLVIHVTATTLYINPAETIIDDIPAGTTKKIYDASDIGFNPTPAFTFSSIRVYDDSNNALNNPSPVDNSAWTEVSNKTTDFYHADFTLEIN